MKKLLLGIMLAGLVLGGCGEKTIEKIVSREGELRTKVGDEFLLNTNEGIVSITSKKIDLENYLKKKIRVRGMFSGTTLYVDEVEEK